MKTLRNMLQEFKAFAMLGNVLDMAVGIIIGGAFGKIVSSLVADVIMPPIGLLMGRVDFSKLAVTLQEGAEATETAPAVARVTLNYGKFIQTVVDFVIVAFSVFMMLKFVNRLHKKEQVAPAPPPPPPPSPPPPTRSEDLLAEIRDLLQQQQKK